VQESPTQGDRPLRRDAQANRVRLLEAAGEVFRRDGIEAPLDEIARRAGVGAGTLYRHFPDRDHLLDALFDDRVRRFDELMTDACQAEDAWAGLVSLLETGFAMQAADRGLKEILVARARGAGHVPKPSDETVAAVAALLERAKAQGALRPDVTLTDMPLISAAIHGVIDLTSSVAPDAWRRILQILLDGLRADRELPTPLPHEPLGHAQVHTAMDERHAREQAPQV
jgi:AcrR family transcriptional regulator